MQSCFESLCSKGSASWPHSYTVPPPPSSFFSDSQGGADYSLTSQGYINGAIQTGQEAARRAARSSESPSAGVRWKPPPKIRVGSSELGLKPSQAEKQILLSHGLEFGVRSLELAHWFDSYFFRHISPQPSPREIYAYFLAEQIK